MEKLTRKRNLSLREWIFFKLVELMLNLLGALHKLREYYLLFELPG